MISNDNIELLFNVLEESSNIISGYMNTDIFTAITYTVENIVNAELVYTNEEISSRLQKLYSLIEDINFQREEIRKAMQFLVLKILKNNKISNVVITPDFVSFFFGYLVKKFIQHKKNFSILNPNMKIGNLLLGIMNSINTESVSIHGIENSDILIRLAKANFDLHNYDADLLFEDSLTPSLGIYDFIVSDLDHVNYENENYNSAFYKKGLKYFPYLFIEKYMNHLSPEGIMILMIPNEFFDKDSYDYKQYLNDNMKMLGLIKLPDDIFAGISKKSILILKHNDSKEFITNDFLLIDLPSLKDSQAFKEVIDRIDQWFKGQYINLKQEGDIV